jgi:hypothetical protein
VVDLRVKLGDISGQISGNCSNRQPTSRPAGVSGRAGFGGGKARATAVLPRAALPPVQMEANDGQRRNLSAKLRTRFLYVFATEQNDNQGSCSRRDSPSKVRWWPRSRVGGYSRRLPATARRSQLGGAFNSQASGSSCEARERIGGLTRRVAELREQLADHARDFPLGGQVIEIKVYQVRPSTPTPIATIQSTENVLEALVCFVEAGQTCPSCMEYNSSPAAHGLKSTVGVPRHRGHGRSLSGIAGRGTAEIRKQALTSAITGQGPVTEVRVGDTPRSHTGRLQWSSHKARAEASGTPVARGLSRRNNGHTGGSAGQGSIRPEPVKEIHAHISTVCSGEEVGRVSCCKSNSSSAEPRTGYRSRLSRPAGEPIYFAICARSRETARAQRHRSAARELGLMGARLFATSAPAAPSRPYIVLNFNH